MSGKIVILPGTPFDDNRDYLPECIKGSDIVVNENGNSSQVYPKRLIEESGVIADGLEDNWCEYVPETYDPSKKTPLVFSMHGGLMTGWGQAIYTSWTMVADRDGFIVVFPNANARKFWTVEFDMKSFVERAKPRDDGVYLNPFPENPDDNHDMKLVLGLIEHMKGKYNIDEGRIFMQGMSMGNMMTDQFARYFGNVLAGAAGSGGPSDLRLLYDDNGKIINRAGHLSIWQSRPERNGSPSGDTSAELKINRLNKEYWLKLNGCKTLPEISILGEDNLTFYKGEKADLVYLDIKNRDHGQTLDDAELIWDYLFSGTRREPDGRIIHTAPVSPRVGDSFAIAAAKDCSNAWLSNGVVGLSGPAILWQKLKYHGLNGDQKVRGEYICVPLSFIARAFNAVLTTSADTLSAILTLEDGRTLQFARGSIGCVIDNKLQSMLCEALHRGGELYVSLEWFCLSIYNMHVSGYDGVLYATDHYSALSMNTADLIRGILSGRDI
jgi:poly(3-hydroxybutyrate) depolymerase